MFQLYWGKSVNNSQRFILARYGNSRYASSCLVMTTFVVELDAFTELVMLTAVDSSYFSPKPVLLG